MNKPRSKTYYTIRAIARGATLAAFTALVLTIMYMPV
jgi:hypothetical protein